MSVARGSRSVVWFVFGVVVASAAAVAVTHAWRADAAPGDTDTTFVPLSPCRLMDTRPEFQVGPRGAPLGTDSTVVVAALGANGDCTVPADAVGLSLNVTAVGATLPTFLTFWDEGDRPTVSSLNPVPGTPPTPNAVITPLAGDGSFRVYNLQGSVDVVVDVNGFFTSRVVDDHEERITWLESTRPRVSERTITDPQVIPASTTRKIVGDLGGFEIWERGHLVVSYSVSIETASSGVRVQCLLAGARGRFVSVPLVWDSPGSYAVGHISGSHAGYWNSYYEIGNSRPALYCSNNVEEDTIITSAHMNYVFYPDDVVERPF